MSRNIKKRDQLQVNSKVDSKTLRGVEVFILAVEERIVIVKL